MKLSDLQLFPISIAKRFLLLLLPGAIALLGCHRSQAESEHMEDKTAISTKVSKNPDSIEARHSLIKGVLLLSKFRSFEEFRQLVMVEYFPESPYSPFIQLDRPMVRLTHRSSGKTVTSILRRGVSETDFIRARDGGFWERIQLGFNSPFAAIHVGDLERISMLARRREKYFGEGDVAFYDLAKTMVQNISPIDTLSRTPHEMGEKGFLNTFNHVTAQAIMTSLYSERVADFIADIHERRTMPDLISGTFTKEQLEDIDHGVVDNYLDIINNEWGQELGKRLKKKFGIDHTTQWTPELLADYLNEMQSYYSWALQLGFTPFRPSDELIIRFSDKLNRVMHTFDELKLHNENIRSTH